MHCYYCNRTTVNHEIDISPSAAVSAPGRPWRLIAASAVPRSHCKARNTSRSNAPATSSCLIIYLFVLFHTLIRPYSQSPLHKSVDSSRQRKWDQEVRMGEEIVLQ